MGVSGTPASGLLDPAVPSQDTNVAQLVAHFYYVLNSSVSVNCCCVAALVWAVYDQLLTWGDEIDYIWSRPSRATDPIYFLTRYAGLASLAITFASYVWPNTTDLFSVATSTTSQYINAQSSWISKFAPALDFSLLWIVEVILQLRVHALYGSPRLAALNVFIFAMEVVLMLSLWLGWPILCSPLIFFGLFDDGSGDLGGTLTSSDDGGNHLFLSIANWHSACPNGSQGAIVPLYWIPDGLEAIIYELWLVGLALAKLRPRLRKHDIVTPLVNDSIMYFVIIAVVMGAHLAMSFSGLFAYGISFVIVSQTIGGTRLMLHLRSIHLRSLDESELGGTWEAEGSRNLNLTTKETRSIVFMDATPPVASLSDDDGEV